MKLERKIVQFHHNGGEHLVSEKSGNIIPRIHKGKILTESKFPWNDGEHRRKFIKIEGKLINNLGDDPESGTIMFWGEFEGASKIEEIKYKEKNKNKGMPKYIHQPIGISLIEYINDPALEIDENRQVKGWQNTDPYVFGEYFIYSNCQQTAKNKDLKNLAPGSVIVFGSHIGAYCLDTVIVIKEVIGQCSIRDYNEIKSYLSNRVNNTYWKITLEPLLGLYRNIERRHEAMASDENILTLYRAASYDNQYNGMYSFFPCKEYEEGKGIARIPVTYKDFITPSLRESHKCKITTEDEAYDYWKSIRDQVLNNEQGLSLGVYAEEPNM